MARSALLVAALLVAAAAVAADQPPDPHYVARRTSSLARRSVFIHGYLHGYEEGFHLADLDIQMGRAPQDISKCKEGRDAAGYRREFGDKHSFQRGYREGLRVGYADATARRSFRAVSELQAIGGDAPPGGEVRADPAFDEGFSVGYVSGQRQGLRDGRREVTPASASASCPAPPALGLDRQTFCAAFAAGYRVGYADGFTNVARPVMAQAEARGGAK